MKEKKKHVHVETEHECCIKQKPEKKERTFTNWDMDREYIELLIRKILETLLSVKVWIIFGVLWLSTWLLTHVGVNGQSYINGQVWGTVNASVISVVVALREGFKISRIRKQNEGEVEDFGDHYDHQNSSEECWGRKRNYNPSKPRMMV
jgi:hypothetical protein